MQQVIVITGASSGFGALTSRALAEAGHKVYASMRETKGRNAKQVEADSRFAREKKVDLRTIELDVASQEPLPPDSPLWKLENAFITPHMSAVSEHLWTRQTDLLIANLERWF